MKEILLVLSALIVAVAMPTPEAPLYVKPLVSGVIFAEESGGGTYTGAIFSFGNGDNNTEIQAPHDMWVYAMSITTVGSCGGTGTVQVYDDGVFRSGLTLDISGTSAGTTFVDPIKIDSGSAIMFYRSAACSSGGDGMTPAIYWVSNALPDSIAYNLQ